jgi:hypothetical protein
VKCPSESCCQANCNGVSDLICNAGLVLANTQGSYGDVAMTTPLRERRQFDESSFKVTPMACV